MNKYEMNKIDRLKSPISRYVVVCALVIVMCACAFVMVVFRTNAILNVDEEVSEADILRVKPVVTSLDVIRSTLNNSNAGTASTYAYAGTPGEFDQGIFDKLVAGGYDEDKALAMTYAWTTFSQKFSPEFALGVMGNIKAEGAAGVVEHAFSKSHAHGFSLPSGKSVVQSAADVEYLKQWDSKSEVKDKGVKKGSCGFGMAQMSFGRRVRLCEAYLSVVTDYSDKHQMAKAEVAYIDGEVSEGGPYADVAKECQGKSTKECASILCLKFEVPAHRQTQAMIRAGYAADIERVLSGN